MGTQTLALLKTKIAYFPNLFRAKFRFCLFVSPFPRLLPSKQGYKKAMGPSGRSLFGFP